MGICLSAVASTADEAALYELRAHAGKAIDEVQAQWCIQACYNVYLEADTDGSGEIGPEEWAEHWRIPHDIFLQKVILLFSSHGKDQIDFKDFIVGLAGFQEIGNTGKEARYKFAWKVLNIEDDNGITISWDDMKRAFLKGQAITRGIIDGKIGTWDTHPDRALLTRNMPSFRTTSTRCSM
mmetsp:Transcript_51298/g.164014  ORF Transcript_51298/g.164014 Transcript_51298/m.164014 type:complete len:181 (-) Transcript_51298:286-828(-)